MPALVSVNAASDILPAYRGTPVAELLEYHNLGRALPPTTGTARMLVAMCMDHRKDLLIPNEFAYVLRSAGGNLRDSEFEVSYAVAVGGVATIALLGHTHCGMAHVTAHREAFVAGLVARAGWQAEAAGAHFDLYVARYHIGDPLGFVVREAARIRALYPKVLVAPLLYEVETDRLAQITGEVGA
jgi:carbonic anhydrase